MGQTLPAAFDAKSLSRSEQIALDHFRKKPEGRGFFAVAEIMAKHQQWDEAVQLLSRGLERHPSYSVARVFLSQALLRGHHLAEAWHNLETSPIPLKGNITAQLLRLKIALLLGMSPEATETVRELALQEFQDAEGRYLIEQMEVKPFAQVRREFADRLRIPIAALPGDRASIDGGGVHPSENYLKAQGRGEIEAQNSFRERVARGFFTSPIHSLFAKPVAAIRPEDNDLDRLTQARLLRRQGLYIKSAGIYQRLVLESPANELLRREFAEICDLRDTQKEIDKQANPELVESMERVRKIDHRLRLLDTLLNRLDDYQNETI